MVRELAERGHTSVLTTHYMEEAEELCHRVAVMDTGQIIALDTPLALIDALMGRGFTKERVERPPTSRTSSSTSPATPAGGRAPMNWASTGPLFVASFKMFVRNRVRSSSAFVPLVIMLIFGVLNFGGTTRSRWGWSTRPTTGEPGPGNVLGQPRPFEITPGAARPSWRS